MSEKTWNMKSQDGIDLFCRSWEGESPRANIVLVHGHGEHSLRYEHMAAFYNQNQISVISFDLRGHGKSGGKRGHTPNYDAMLNDIEDVIDNVVAESPAVPCILYGHSMGGNLVLNYGFRNPTNVKAVVASSPWIKLAFDPPQSKIMMAKLLNGIFPAMTLGSGLDASLLSHDKSVCSKYQQDPLVHDLISVRMYNEMYNHGLTALENAAKFPLPLFLFHGSEDQLTSPAASTEFAKKMGKKATLKIWEGLYHETHNEAEKQEVFAETLNWINQQIM
jgi:alpha-beta hydrolase superfamily lysophospholipase